MVQAAYRLVSDRSINHLPLLVFLKVDLPVSLLELNFFKTTLLIPDKLVEERQRTDFCHELKQ